MSNRKPTRRDLLVVIQRLQQLAGRAKHAAMNDRNPERMRDLLRYTEEAEQLCLDAQSFDPIIRASGPWAPQGTP